MYILVKPFNFITETNHLRMSVFASPPVTLPTFLLPSRDIAERSLKRIPTSVSYTFYTTLILICSINHIWHAILSSSRTLLIVFGCWIIGSIPVLFTLSPSNEFWIHYCERVEIKHFMIRPRLCLIVLDIWYSTSNNSVTRGCSFQYWRILPAFLPFAMKNSQSIIKMPMLFKILCIHLRFCVRGATPLVSRVKSVTCVCIYQRKY